MESIRGRRRKITCERVDGNFFLTQHVDLEQNGQKIEGTEIIGHEREFGADPSEDVKSRFYDNAGNTFDYVRELDGDTLTV